MARAFLTLVGAAVAGGLIWVAAQLSQETTGGYWARIGILAGAGLALALARLPDVGVRSLSLSLPTLGLAFLPSLVTAGWIVVATQPHGNTFRRHVLSWSSDIHVAGVVRDLGPYAIVLAFGLGVVLGLVFERRAIETVVTEPLVREPVETHETVQTAFPVEARTAFATLNSPGFPDSRLTQAACFEAAANGVVRGAKEPPSRDAESLIHPAGALSRSPKSR